MVALTEFASSAAAEDSMLSKDAKEFIPSGLSFVPNPEVEEFVPSAAAKEFVSGFLLCPPGFFSPPGLTAPPGLLEAKVFDLSSDEAEKLAPPLGFEVVAPGLTLAPPSSGPDLEDEDTKRLAEENLRLSNQCLELETARLTMQNELLRAQLALATASASGPPGVFLPPAAVRDGPPGVFLAGSTADPWAESAAPGVWAPPGLEVLTCDELKDDDAESHVSEASTQAVSDFEDSDNLSSVSSRRASSFSEALTA